MLQRKYYIHFSHKFTFFASNFEKYTRRVCEAKFKHEECIFKNILMLDYLIEKWDKLCNLLLLLLLLLQKAHKMKIKVIFYSFLVLFIEKRNQTLNMLSYKLTYQVRTVHFISHSVERLMAILQ